MASRHHSRRSFGVLLTAGLASAHAGLAQATPTPEPAGEQIGGRPDMLARLTAPVFVNGYGPFNFVVDTGSNRSVISSELARELGLPAAESMVINTVAGQETSAAVLADSLMIGERISRNVVLSATPQRSIGGPGLIGIEQLKGQTLTLDFERRKLVVSPSGRLMGGHGRILVKAEQKSGRLALVDAEVGGIAVTAFVDSGSQVTLANPALRKLLGGQVKPISDLDPYPQVPVIGVTGNRVMGHMGILPMIKVGGLYVHKLPVVFADLHTFHFWGLDETPAIVLGVDLLRKFERVDMDFSAGRVRFSLPGYNEPATGTLIPGSAPSGARVLKRG